MNNKAIGWQMLFYAGAILLETLIGISIYSVLWHWLTGAIPLDPAPVGRIHVGGRETVGGHVLHTAQDAQA